MGPELFQRLVRGIAAERLEPAGDEDAETAVTATEPPRAPVTGEPAEKEPSITASAAEEGREADPVSYPWNLSRRWPRSAPASATADRGR